MKHKLCVHEATVTAVVTHCIKLKENERESINELLILPAIPTK